MSCIRRPLVVTLPPHKTSFFTHSFSLLLLYNRRRACWRNHYDIHIDLVWVEDNRESWFVPKKDKHGRVSWHLDPQATGTILFCFLLFSVFRSFFCIFVIPCLLVNKSYFVKISRNFFLRLNHQVASLQIIFQLDTLVLRLSRLCFQYYCLDYDSIFLPRTNMHYLSVSLSRININECTVLRKAFDWLVVIIT